MVCSHPIKGYWSKRRHPSTGNRYVVFSPKDGYADRPIYVPCGKCVTCRLAKSFEWSVRCTCESYFHDETYFLTLTYDDENLPEDKCLNRLDFQLFMKRLRRRFEGHKLKVFYCGEYGEKRNRPHYHAIIFGLPLKQKNYALIEFGRSNRGNVNYISPRITKIWKKGLVTIGTFSNSAASYVAQYTIKKCKKNYKCKKAVKPFIGMSNRMPIGFSFFEKYHRDIFRRGGFYVDLGQKNKTFVRPLRFFKRSLEKYHHFLYWKYYIYKNKFHNPDVTETGLEPILYRSNRYKYGQLLDKKISNRYIKEERLLRKYEDIVRLDL